MNVAQLRRALDQFGAEEDEVVVDTSEGRFSLVNSVTVEDSTVILEAGDEIEED